LRVNIKLIRGHTVSEKVLEFSDLKDLIAYLNQLRDSQGWIAYTIEEDRIVE
jgi:hypothetical protein